MGWQRGWVKALVVVAATLMLSVNLVTPANAVSRVACGVTLTRDTVLTRDLRCAGRGLTLAPGVTLDLAGHHLIGNGRGTAIIASAGQNTVRHGTVRGWGLGVERVSESGFAVLTLDRMRVVNAPLDLDLQLIVQRSVLLDSPVRVWAGELSVAHSTLIRSTTSGEMNTTTVRSSRIIGGGVGIDENTSVSVFDSLLDGTGFTFPASLCMVKLEGSVVQNYANPLSADASICSALSVRHTLFSHNRVAVESVWREEGQISATIQDSTFRHNGVGVSGGGFTVTRSRFVGNGSGVVVDSSGIFLDTAADTAITASTFSRNRDNGIYTEAPGLRLRGNKAVRNGRYGIYAPGAKDLGGNAACRNGVADCVGVVCRPPRS